MPAELPKPRIEPARPADEAAIRELLRQAGLPHVDFAAHLATFLVARDGDGTVGAVGCEDHGADALLRSLVVAPRARGRGLGDALVRALADRAAKRGVKRFYLLTTTAEKYFTARGFTRCDRAAVPAGIAAAEEFRSLCPASAVCLARAVLP